MVAAQDDTAAQPGGETVVLDTIRVTTRRTEEALEAVPGSVVVLDDQEIERADIRNSIDVIRRLPNVSFTEGSDPTDVDLSIRGISSLVGTTAATGPTNGVFVDGLLLNPTGSLIGINPNLFDLERVEVAFGPQGTAFGRGTIGGAINLVPKRPTEEREIRFEGGIGSFPDGDVRAIFNTPILDDGLLSARFVGFFRSSNGFVELPTVGGDAGQEDIGGRLSLRSTPTDRLTLDFAASFDRSEFDAANSVLLSSAEDGDPQNVSDFVEEDTLDRAVVSFDAAYDFDFGTVRSKTGFLRTDLDGKNDSDSTALDIFTTEIDSVDEAISQEFRFESEVIDLPSGLGTLTFNPGVSFSFNDSRDDFIIDAGDDFFTASTQFGLDSGILVPGQAIVDDGSFSDVDQFQEVDTFGIFGDVRWRPVPELEIAAGARFSRDTVRVEAASAGEGLVATGIAQVSVFPGGPVVPVDVSGLIDVPFPDAPLTSAEETFTAVTPNASVLYEWTDQFSTYVSFSTGFRPGGFSLDEGAIAPFDEETVRNFEGGFRANLLENRLQLR
ncbi:MAG: TonB-dependent receptor, partial [Pseudomonadota bacterium]